MPRLFRPNFDFEHELAADGKWQPSQKLRQLNTKFAPLLAALCAEDDRIVLPEKPVHDKVQTGPVTIKFASELEVRQEREFSGPDWELVPWGATRSLQQLAEQRGWRWHQPPADVVKHWNDRLTAFEYERKHEANPEGSRIAESFVATLTALERLPASKWVIKARFGMSARERIVGEGTSLSDAQRGWLKKRFKEQQSVIVEPWLKAISEAGLQFEIPREGAPRLLAVLPLLNSATGEYRGSRLFLTEREQPRWQPAIELGLQIASSAQEHGYFGPFGIDAMLYRDGDEVRLRPVQDINARWTMGRIAWEWGQRLAPGEDATWLVGTAAEEWKDNPPVNARVIPTSSGGPENTISMLSVEPPG